MDNIHSDTDYPRERQLVMDLRAEAWQVKHCFTDFSFKALALAGIVLGFVSQFLVTYPQVGFAGVLVTLLLLTVARIGTHKYGTSNRIYGYILHLERISHLRDQNTQILRNMGWEEAMKAWRVVQATTFDNLYEHGPFVSIRFFRFIKRRNIPKCRNDEKKYKWYEPQALVNQLKDLPDVDVNSAVWHPGDYLTNMIYVLHLTAILAISPLVYCVIDAMFLHNGTSRGLGWSSAATLLLMLLTLVYQIGRTNARRRVLEEGLLSIHSCAVMWHAVAIAHHRALMALSAKGLEDLQAARQEVLPTTKSYRYYTACLAYLASDLNKDILSIHAWIDDEQEARLVQRLIELKGSLSSFGGSHD